MDMDIDIDIGELFAPKVLLHLVPTDLALRLRDVAAESQPDGIQNITARLLNDIHSGAVQPLVFKIWLPLAVHHIPALVRPALLDKGSYGVRNAGISALKRALDGDRWREDGWDAVGGTQGLAEVFETLCINQVAKLVRVIGKFNRSQDPAKAAAVDDLVRLLMPTLLRSSRATAPSPDSISRRFLFSELTYLIPGCSTAFLSELFSCPIPESFRKIVLFRGLARLHLDFMRKIAIGEIEVHKSVRQDTLDFCSEDLVLSVEPYQPRNAHSGISQSVSHRIHFLLDVISFEENAGNLHSPAIQKWIGYATRLALRRTTPFSDVLVLLETITSSMERCGTKFDLRGILTMHVVRCWAAASYPTINMKRKVDSTRRRRHRHISKPDPEHGPSLYSLMIRIMRRASDDNMAKDMNIYLSDLFKPGFPLEARLPFIKTLFRYAPGLGIDLDAASLSGKDWPHKSKLYIPTLNQLPCDDAKWLSERVTSLAGGKDAIVYKYDQVGRPWHAVTSQPSWCLERHFEVKWEAEGTSGEDNPIAKKCTLEQSTSSPFSY